MTRNAPALFHSRALVTLYFVRAGAFRGHVRRRHDLVAILAGA